MCTSSRILSQTLNGQGTFTVAKCEINKRQLSACYLLHLATMTDVAIYCQPLSDDCRLLITLSVQIRMQCNGRSDVRQCRADPSTSADTSNNQLCQEIA